MCRIRRLNCSMSSALSGIKWFRKHGRAGQKFQGMSLDRPATCTSPYTKAPIRPQHDSPRPLVTMTSIWCILQHTHCAGSPAIFTAALHPELFLLLMSKIAPRPCRCLTTPIPLVRPLNPSTFPLPHQINPTLVQCETRFPENREAKDKSETLSPLRHSALQKLPQSDILLPLSSHPLLFSSEHPM